MREEKREKMEIANTKKEERRLRDVKKMRNVGKQTVRVREKY